jgi:hypothetical protein
MTHVAVAGTCAPSFALYTDGKGATERPEHYSKLLLRKYDIS